MAVQFATNPLVDELLQPEDIHEEYKQSLLGLPLFVIVALLLTVFHGLNLYYSVFVNDSLGMFALIHLLLSVGTYFFAKAQDKADGDPRFAYLLLVMALVLGPLGALGTLATALLVGFYSRVSLSFKEWFATLFPDRKVPKLEQMYDDIILGRDENGKSYSVQSFTDVMTVGSDVQKRTALSRMTAAFRPDFSPAFKLALQDTSPTVRVHAATAITKIENMFYDRLVKLQTLSEHYPKRAEVKRALALHYDDYAFTGLLDPYRESQNRERAHAVYLEYLAQNPSDTLVRQNIGRLLVRSGKVREAADWFKACIDEGHVTDAIKLWYFECLFNAGEFQRLRDAVFTLPLNVAVLEKDKPELAEALLLWSQGRRNTTGQSTSHVA
jgi:tetratricopeptide (TPR) repeat protein